MSIFQDDVQDGHRISKMRLTSLIGASRPDGIPNGFADFFFFVLFFFCFCFLTLVV